MSANRLLAASPEAQAERKRACELTSHLIDSVLETGADYTPDTATGYLLRRFAWELAHLSAVIREGGDAADLERRLSSTLRVM